MNLAKALRLAMHVQLAASSLALITAGNVTFISGVVMLLFTVVAYFSGGLWPRGEKLRKKFWNVLAVIMLVVFVAELIIINDLLASVVRLVVFLCIYKLFSLTANKDYITILLLSFLQMLAATSISYESVYTIPYIIYVFSCGMTLLLHTKKTGIEREQLSKNIITGFPRPADLETVKPRKMWFAFGLCALTLAITAMIFPFFPRLRTNVMGPGDNNAIQSISGFSQSVTLGSIGDIKTSPALIMRASLTGDLDSLPRRPKLKGIVLTLFDGNTWRHVFAGGRAIRQNPDGIYRINSEDQGVVIEQEIFLNPINSRSLFATGIPYRSRGPFRVLYIDDMYSLFQGRRQFKQIRYWTSSGVIVAGDRLVYDTQEPNFNERQQFYLRMPANQSFNAADRRRIRELALEITSGANTDLERAEAIEQYLSTSFEYSLELSRYRNDRNKMISFLFDRQSAHCEYFASGMTLLCRSIGIPTRMVNGFQLGQYNPVGDFYTIRAADAHSWVEVYIAGSGWLEFDPTPASGQESNFARAEQDFLKSLLDSLDMFWTQYVLAFDALDQRAVFDAMRTSITGVLDFFGDISDSLLALLPEMEFFANLHDLLHWLLTGFLILLTCFVLYLALFRPILRQFRRKPSSGKLSIEFFQQGLHLLKKQGIQLEETESARSLILKTENLRYQEEVKRLVTAYERARFATQKTSRKDAEMRGRDSLQALRSELKKEQRNRTGNQ